MHILYLADIRFPLERANGIQTMQTCHALARRGHHVTLRVREDTATPARDPGRFYGLPPIATLAIEQTPAPAWPPLRRACYLAAALARSLVASAWDVVFTRDLGAAALLARVPAGVRPPLVYESHGFAPLVRRELPDLLSQAEASSTATLDRLEAREQLVWRRAEGYVTITQGLARELESRFGARGNLAVVPDGVRLAPDRRFEPPRATAAPVVAYAGHFYPWKGVDALLRALAQIPEGRGLLVGGHASEPDVERLRALVAELGIANRVTFTGFVDPPRVAELLRGADILVLPNVETTISRTYTSPLKLFEYLALGKPVIASDLPAIREVAASDEVVLVAPGNPDALAAAIGGLVSNPARAHMLAERAFARAAEFSWERRAERLEPVVAAAARKAAP